MNKALVDFLGYEAEELAELTVEEITHPDDIAEDREQADRLIDGQIERYELEKRYMRKSGEPVWALLAVSLVRDEDGNPLYFISQIKDITNRKQVEADLRRVAAEDSLTGVANRRQFEADLATQVSRCRRQMETAALLMLDIDSFKSVNDTLGHSTGDQLLREIAQRLRARVRQSDLVARLGGDEFVVMVETVSDRTGLHLLAAKILAAVGEPMQLQGHEVTVTASIGISVFPDDGSDVSSPVSYTHLTLPTIYSV
mgnify:CR=1 FL=1